MTREEFFYQCQDVIEHWLNGNRKLSDLREVTDKLYNEVTKPHWISVDDELPKEKGWIIITSLGEVDMFLYYNESAVVLKDWYHITHWMPLPQAPTCSEKPNNSKKGE